MKKLLLTLLLLFTLGLAAKATAVTYTVSAVSKSEPFTVTFADANGNTNALSMVATTGTSAPLFASAEDLRIYAGGTLTITSANENITEIVFNLSVQGKKRLAPITASVGAIATQKKGDATVTWTGDAKEVTFTVGEKANYGSESGKAGQLCFSTFEVAAGEPDMHKVFTFEGFEKNYVLNFNEKQAYDPAFPAEYPSTIKFESNASQIATADNNGVHAGTVAGTATITVTWEQDDTFKSGDAEFTVTVKDPNAAIEGYELLTDANKLYDGAEGYILNSANDYIMGAQKEAYRTGVSIGKNAFTEGVLTNAPEGATLVTFEKTADGKKYNLKVGEKYLNTTVAKKIYEKDTPTSAEITVSSNNAIIKFSDDYGWIQFNNSANPKRFLNYATTQGPVQIYIKPKQKGTFKPTFSDVALVAGEKKTITVEDGAPAITFKSENKAVATVEGNTITAVGGGEATITATWDADDNWIAGEATFKVTVTKITTSVIIGQASVILAEKTKVTQQATVTPEGVSVTYSSSDETVATVDAETGEVTAVTAGNATITATVGNDQYATSTATYTVTVVAEGDVNKLDGEISWGPTVTRSVHGWLSVPYEFNLQNYKDAVVIFTLVVKGANGNPLSVTFDNIPTSSQNRVAAETFIGLKETENISGKLVARGEALGTVEHPSTQDMTVEVNATVDGKKVQENNEVLDSPLRNTTGIEDVMVDGNAEAEYYNLQGLRVAQPEAGQLYIKRQGGQAVKVRF